MKTRQGFVSNSSSSSFVVAIDKNKPTKITLTIDVDINDYSRNICNTEGELLEYYFEENDVISLEELKQNFEYQYDEYLKCLKEIKEGKTIYFGSFSSDGDPIETLLCDNGLENAKTENVKVIYNEAGF